MLLFKVVIFIFNLFKFILKLLYLFLLLLINIFQCMYFFFVFIMLYPTYFYIYHTPEKTSIRHILFSYSIILQKLQIFHISSTHIISYHASLFLKVKTIYLFLVG
jgi:hypothetical protein